MNTQIKQARKILNWFLEETNQDCTDFDLEDLKSMMQSIIDNYSDFIVLVDADSKEKPNEHTDYDLYRAWELVQCAFNRVGDVSGEYSLTELFDLINEVERKFTTSNDFYIDSFAGGECRFISEHEIDEIAKECAEQIIEDCYEINTDNLPSFVAIDWEATVENYMHGQDYGQLFGSYDHTYDTCNDYVVMRTN